MVNNMVKKKASGVISGKKIAAKSGSKARSMIGLKAPSLALSATSDQVVNLSLMKKQIVVLYFYPKDKTPGCTLEGQDFTRLRKKFEKNGAHVFGVSSDSLRSHESFRKSCQISIDLIGDADQKLAKAFDVIQMKSLYGKNYLGIERSTFVIDQKSVVRAEWRKVKVLGHAEEVLKFVESLV